MFSVETFVKKKELCFCKDHNGRRYVFTGPYIRLEQKFICGTLLTVHVSIVLHI